MKRTPLARKTELRRKAEMRKVNRKRIRTLRIQQFGADGYREHILTLPCLVRRIRPVDPAHVLGTRAAGHGPEGLAPLSREVHFAFDTLGEDRFAELYGRTKESIREWARRHRRAWENGEVFL